MKTEFKMSARRPGKEKLVVLYHYPSIGWPALYSLEARYRYSSREGDLDDLRTK